MNKQEIYQEDPLKQYINSDKREKVPEGFTSKVMTRIQFETIPVTAAEKRSKRSLVPVVSASVIIILLIAASLIPANNSDSLTLPVLNLINNVKSLLPDLNLSSVFSISLPAVILYVIIGILVLTFFDRALYSMFHREK
jgi:hypothetical protein